MGKFAMGDVNMAIPDGFSLHMAVVAAKPENKFCRNLVIAKEVVPQGMTVDVYKQAQLKMLSQSSGFSTVKSGTLPIDGENSPFIETESVGPGGLPLASLIAYVKKGDTVFTLTCTNTKGAAFAAAREEFLAMLKSFSVGKG